MLYNSLRMHLIDIQKQNNAAKEKNFCHHLKLATLFVLFLFYFFFLQSEAIYQIK